MTSVWIDVLTPKQFWFFRRVTEELARRRFDLTVSSRAYEQVLPLIPEFKHAEVMVVGEYGGLHLRDKLIKSVERTRELLQAVGEFDCAVSGGSPEAARISYGLGKPHILASDTPNSPVNKLVAPVSAYVLSPWIVGKKPWRKLGVQNQDIVLYRALDPVAWLRSYKPSKQFLHEHGLDERNYVLVRTPEYKASYFINFGWSVEHFSDFLKKMVKQLRDYKIVVLPRYSDEVAYLCKHLGDEAVVVDRPVKDFSLLYYAEVFVGGGGTMTQEAALLGVPTVSFYPSRLPKVIQYLKNQGLIIHVNSLQKLLDKAEAMLRDADRIRSRLSRRARRLVGAMEDPVEKIVNVIEDVVSPAG
ncbi:MAG: DUF354 domain-containing protein [Candidatus Caldarchaeum sp.]|uniref:DUF354 domain-containing protein n=1 Tax=Caldiarchaeum subterraneum TaxID=311458 RepID=A0A7C5QNN2_CALS0